MLPTSHPNPTVIGRSAGRATTWIIIAVAMLAVGAAAVLMIPEAVRRLAVTRLAETTGEPVAIADVDFNPFTGRFRARQVRVGEPAAPLLTVDALEGRLRMAPLLSGRVRVDEATFSRPVVRISRIAPATLNISAVIDRFRRQPARETPLDAAIDRLAIVDGTVAFEDRVLQPVRRWSAEHLSVELRHLGTAPDAGAGTGVLTFAVAGGRVSVAAQAVDVAPFATEAIVRVEAVPLSALASYLPANPEVAPTGGIMDAVLTVEYDEADGLRGNGWTVLRNLGLRRAGQAEPFVTVPALTASATDLRLRGAGIGASRVSVSATPTVVDGRVSPSARFEFTSTSLLMRDVQWPGGGAAPVELSATLADGASMTARGTLDIGTLSGNLEVVLANVALGRFNAYVPPNAPVTVRDGVLHATLQTRHVGAAKVQVSGRGTVRGVAVARRDAGDIVSIPSLGFAVADSALTDGVVTVARVELTGDPTITAATPDPRHQVALQQSRVVVEGLRWPPGPPVRVEVTTRMATGGSLALQGTVVPTPLDADVTVTSVDLDLRPFTRYVPADWPVRVERATLSTRATVRHSAGTTRVEGTASVRRLAILRKDRSEPLARARALDVEVAALEIADGRATAGRIVATGGAIITDASVTPPSRFALREGRVVVEALSWPQGAPARVEATARLETGGSVAVQGTLAPSPLAADVTVTATDLDLVPLRVYLPPASPVQLERGVLTARTAVRHSAGATQVDGTASVRRLAVLRKDGSQPRVRARAIDLEVAALEIADGRVSARRIVATGGATITDASVTPPSRLALREGRVVMEALSWPQGSPARVEASARLETGGSLTVQGTLAPSPLVVDVAVTATDLDLVPLRAYVPPALPVQLERGVLTARTAVKYSGGTTQVDGTASVRRLNVLPKDHPQLRVRVRAIDLDVTALEIADGRATARRIVVTGAPTVTDASVTPPSRFALREGRAIVEALSWPQGPPARINLTAGVATGGSLAVLGTLAPSPLTADVTVAVNDVDLHPFRGYVPASSPAQLGGGILTARTTVRHSGGTTRLDATATIAGLRVLRRDRSEPFLTAPAIDVRARDVTLVDGRLAARRIVVRGTPTVIDAEVTPPQRHEFETLRVTVTDASRPSTRPAEIELVARATRGGSVRATGRVDLTSLDAEIAATIEGVPVARAQPYLPADAPVSLASGFGSGQVAFRYSGTTGPRLSADLTIRDLGLDRRGQRERFVSVPMLQVSASDVAIGEGRTAADRLELRGDVQITDALASPPRRLDARGTHVVLTGGAWPATAPARLRLTSDIWAGRLEVTGSVAAAPARARLNALLTDLDLAQLAALVPDVGGIALQRGRAGASAQIRHDAASGTRIEGQITGIGVELLRRPGALTASVPTVTIGVRDGHVRDGRLTAARLEIDGSARIVDSSPDGAPPVDLSTLRLVAEQVNWPATEAMPVTLDATFAGGGALSASGTVPPAMDTSSLQVKARAVPLSMLGPFLPVHAPVRGEVDADLTVGIDTRDALRLAISGTAEGRSLALGPRRRPPLSVEHVTASGFRVDWPRRVEAEAIVLRGFSATIERTETGEFPLRDLLMAPGVAPAALASAALAFAEPAPARPALETRAATLDIAIGRFEVERGYVRFVDHSTSPFYSEELSELGVLIEGFSTAPAARARLDLKGVLGVKAAVDLRGEVAPFGAPFFLEVRGEIRDFPVARVNPYAQRLLDWVARTGEVTTEVHYRVTGDRLEATNGIVVQRLNVARAGGDRAAAERLGVPLGLAVALLKDSRGDIRLTVPVTGRLGSPEFSLRDAFGTALRNVVVKAIALPFQMMGKLFKADEEATVPEIDPVEFAPGSAGVTPALERELQRVADFLRASPFVGLELSAIVTEADLRELAAREVTVRIQELQRARALESFDSAAVQLFHERFPGRAVPETTQSIVSVLRDAEPAPEAAGWRLADRRLESTRRMLTERAGIEPGRLRQSEQRIPPGASGAGRVKFTIVPAG